MVSGIFNSDDDKDETAANSSDEADEILAELKKKQAELRALSHQNAIMLRHLHKQAKEELQSQELKKKMATADAEVSVQDSRICSMLFTRWPLVWKNWKCPEIWQMLGGYPKSDQKLGKCEGKILLQKLSVASFMFGSMPVFISVHVYYTVIYVVGNRNLGRSAAKSRWNVIEFHSA